MLAAAATASNGCRAACDCGVGPRLARDRADSTLFDLDTERNRVGVLVAIVGKFAADPIRSTKVSFVFSGERGDNASADDD
jgi:hypothetical protein